MSSVHDGLRARVGRWPHRDAQQPTPAQRPTYNRNDPNFQVVHPRWLAWALGSAVYWRVLLCLPGDVCAVWAGVVATGLASDSEGGREHGTGRRGTGEVWAGRGRCAAACRGVFCRRQPWRKVLLHGTTQRCFTCETVTGQLGFADAPLLAMLHDLGMNVLAFDYRGFGSSVAKPHPSEPRMLEDAESAWEYLRGLRGVSPQHIVIYGAGVGGSLAVAVGRRDIKKRRRWLCGTRRCGCAWDGVARSAKQILPGAAVIQEPFRAFLRWMD